jgi:ElaB/YqjD/DUF883 family membrane-anchored ribosome-binding protein
MTDRKAYQQKMEARLNEWKAELDRMRAKVQGVEADARIEFDKQLTDIRERFETIREHFSSLAKAGGDSYERVRGTVDGALAEFTNAFEAFKQKLRDREPAHR